MNRGVPPTAANARTGEFTPPGVTCRARSNHACEAAEEGEDTWAFSPTPCAPDELRSTAGTGEALKFG
jgi:hypothetical protein